VEACHFLREDMTATNDREKPWKRGETRIWSDWCNSRLPGYYSYLTWLDALTHAVGPIACKVNVSPPIHVAADRQISTRRTLIDYRNAAKTLRRFALDCVERLLKAGEVTDENVWNILRDERYIQMSDKAAWEELDSVLKHLQPKGNVSRTGLQNALLYSTLSDPTMAAKRTAASSRYAISIEAWKTNKPSTTEYAWQLSRLDNLMSELFLEEREGGNK